MAVWAIGGCRAPAPAPPGESAELRARLEQQLARTQRTNELLEELLERMDALERREDLEEVRWMVADLQDAMRGLLAMAGVDPGYPETAGPEAGDSGSEPPGSAFAELLADLPDSEFWSAEANVDALSIVYRRDPDAAFRALVEVDGAPGSLEQFAQALCSTNLSSHVQFETEEPDAWVHWSFLGRDEDLRADEKTHGAEAEVCIGYYRVWTEREGERTSEQVLCRILDEEETVYLEEFSR